MQTQIRKKLLAASLLLPALAGAQGTMVFDQRSSDESNGGVGGNIIQNSQPTGQSFTPLLNGIDFVRFNLLDFNRNNGLGATLYVNLRSDSISGPIIDSTAPVALADNFGFPLNTGYVTFLFGNRIPLQPGVMYFLQPVVQSGDSWAFFSGSFGYPGGDLYVNGTAGSSDYWFQEGVIVPEPSLPALLMAGAGISLYLRSRKR
jgi:hypothetical protein